MRGVFAVWKPAELLSSKLVNRIKITLQGGAKYLSWSDEIERYGGDYSGRRGKYMLKVGHGGTLDSFAEGVMVVGVGEACKQLTKYLVGSNKDYTVVCELGKTTDTLDPTGVVLREAPWDHITREQLESALGRFRGPISQVPPVFSANRINGRRFSDIAHKARKTGSPMPVLPQAKPVTIYSLELLDFEPPSFTLSVSCSSGTYMRSLARDVAEAVGSVGYATAVVRTRQGGFTQDSALFQQDWTLEKIRDALHYSAGRGQHMYGHNQYHK